MSEKLPEQMDRAELIGTVHALRRQIEEFTSPDHNAAYALGRLALIERGELDVRAHGNDTQGNRIASPRLSPVYLAWRNTMPGRQEENVNQSPRQLKERPEAPARNSAKPRGEGIVEDERGQTQPADKKTAQRR